MALRQRKYDSLQDRIIANSVLSVDSWFGGSPCWEWIGSRRGGGYPSMCVRWKSGKRKGKVRTVSAHRISLKVFKGRYLGTRYVGMHLCHNRNCVNPEHLAGGTQKRNMNDMVKAGRHRNGSSLPLEPEFGNIPPSNDVRAVEVFLQSIAEAA